MEIYNLARTVYEEMKGFAGFIYEGLTGGTSKRGLDYALLGVSSQGVYQPNIDQSSAEDYMNFMSSRTQRKKGTSNKHNGNHTVTRTVNGKTVVFDKKGKPKDISLKKWISLHGISEKEARKIAKEFH